MQNIDTLILGGTFFGIACAMNNPANSLILEKRYVIGSDFINCMNLKKCDLTKMFTPQTEELIHSLRKRNLLSETGEHHLYPISGVLADMICKNNINIMLDTEVLSIQQEDDYYKVRIFNRDGFCEIKAKTILDTTTTGILHRLFDHQAVAKSIGAMLINGSSDLGGYRDESIFIQQGLFDHEFVLRVRLDRDDDWISARQKLQNCINTYGDTLLAGWQIASVASSFAYDFHSGSIQKEVQKNWVWHPSASHEDFISAFEEGQQEREPMYSKKI